MNTLANLSSATIENITVAIQTELLKRGFTAPLSAKEKGTGERGYHFDITSQPFNTVPVIMKEITIEARVWVSESDRKNILNVGTRVDVRYSHFSGGTNGTELFTFYCLIRNDRDEIFDVNVR
jgi:hypothetical protein